MLQKDKFIICWKIQNLFFNNLTKCLISTIRMLGENEIVTWYQRCSAQQHGEATTLFCHKENKSWIQRERILKKRQMEKQKEACLYMLLICCMDINILTLPWVSCFEGFHDDSCVICQVNTSLSFMPLQDLPLIISTSDYIGQTRSSHRSGAWGLMAQTLL